MAYKPPPTEALVRQREVECWKWRCAGWTLQKIGEHLDISREAVRKILRRVDARELKSLSRHYEHLKIIQYNRLEHVIEECSLSWQKSKTPRKKASQRTTDGGDGDDGATITGSEVVERDGDTAYLYCLMVAMDRQVRLFGLDVQAEPHPGGFASITELILDLKKREEEHESGEGARRTWGEEQQQKILARREAARRPQSGEEPPGLHGPVRGDQEAPGHGRDFLAGP
jgi:DNA-binding CsgD family transcriptional regulator